MSITDRQRLKLLRTLETAIGPEDAGTLMDHLPPVTWANVATVDHVSSVGHQTATALRGEMQVLSTQLRSEMNQLGTELRTEMNQLGVQLRGEMNQLGIELRSEVERVACAERQRCRAARRCQHRLDQQQPREPGCLKRGGQKIERAIGDDADPQKPKRLQLRHGLDRTARQPFQLQLLHGPQLFAGHAVKALGQLPLRVGT